MEFALSQSLDRVVDAPTATNRHGVEVHQNLCLDHEIDVPVAMKRQTSLSLRVTRSLGSRDNRVDEDSGHGRLRGTEDSWRLVCCAEAVWLPREQRASVCRHGRGLFMVRDDTGSQAMTTAATAHGRGGRHARCCAREPKANENTDLQRRILQREQDATSSHSAAGQTPFQVARACAGRPFKKRIARCEHYAKQGTRPRPIHSDPQEKETETVRPQNRMCDHRQTFAEAARGFDPIRPAGCRIRRDPENPQCDPKARHVEGGFQAPMQSTSMSGKEPVERGEDDQGDHQTTARWQPAHRGDGMFTHVQTVG